MAFVIDTKGAPDIYANKTSNSADDSDDDFVFIPLSKKSEPSNGKGRSTTNSKEDDINFDDTYLDFHDNSNRLSSKKTPRELARRFTDASKVLQKSVLQPGVEKLHTLPSYAEGRRVIAKRKKMEREKTAGKDWYNMKAPEITEEMRNDLEVLQMRSALDPKHFYKKNDLKTLPKYFQVGRVIESAADFYHSRIPKKERKKTLVDELLADAEFQKSAKQRYKEIIAEQQKTSHKSHRQAKRLKKKK